MLFVLRDAKRACARRKKAGHGCCGRTIEAQPLSDQTCHIEDVLAAPCRSNREGIGNGGFLGAHLNRLGMRSLATSLGASITARFAIAVLPPLERTLAAGRCRCRRRHERLDLAETVEPRRSQDRIPCPAVPLRCGALADRGRGRHAVGHGAPGTAPISVSCAKAVFPASKSGRQCARCGHPFQTPHMPSHSLPNKSSWPWSAAVERST